jgi:succinate dehydrogenase / fumarate reductase membrane anchor subunit
MAATTTRRVDIPQNYETISWKWMRYSGILMIPLVWVHVILQDVIVGVHAMDAAYVASRWGVLFWQVYDILLLGFTFAHGVNGLRQVLRDYIHRPDYLRWINIGLLIFWAVISFIGAFAIVNATNSVLFQ